MSNNELRGAIHSLQGLLTEAADALQESVNSMIESHTDPVTGLIDDDARLSIESDTDLIDRLRAAAVPFCQHCGGNDEDPQDHCMDCTRPRWEPVTQELLNNQHPWLYEPMWIASKDRRVFAGFYEWRQGGKPDRFVTEDGDSWAFDASHVMPIVKPSPPEPEKGQP
jgi:hypothetical protein